MKVYKENTKKVSVSLILVDWSCRESLHVLDYLKKQTCKDFEVIWIEYYDRVIEELKYLVNTYIVLNISKKYYYHKHLMYNVGLFYAKGDIIVIMDSDVMLKSSFISSILDEFEKYDNIVLHLDEFRNINPEYYPFNYPAFEEFVGNGCINCNGNITKGFAYPYDIIHNLNFGACFCAKKEDLFKIKGADEHIDYLGHICGPYEMSFRLNNLGKDIKWSKKEFLYHTWHPGTDGKNNYLGPHDGKNFSLRALELLDNNKIEPYVANGKFMGEDMLFNVLNFA